MSEYVVTKNTCTQSPPLAEHRQRVAVISVCLSSCPDGRSRGCICSAFTPPFLLSFSLHNLSELVCGCVCCRARLCCRYLPPVVFVRVCDSSCFSDLAKYRLDMEGHRSVLSKTRLSHAKVSGITFYATIAWALEPALYVLGTLSIIGAIFQLIEVLFEGKNLLPSAPIAPADSTPVSRTGTDSAAASGEIIPSHPSPNLTMITYVPPSFEKPTSPTTESRPCTSGRLWMRLSALVVFCCLSPFAVRRKLFWILLSLCAFIFVRGHNHSI